jgi:phage terminase large subunit-like protein
MKVYAADSDTADGVIPTLSLLDEGHRMKDLSLYRTWHGKRRKRRSQTGMISTAGVPGSDFEMTRDALRDSATDITRRGECYGRYATETTVLHEFAVPSMDMVRDIDIVKAANPLSTIRKSDLRAALASPTLDFGEDWLRLTCNIPARSSKAAVNELDWLRARPRDPAERIIPEGVPVAVGADFAWILDTTAIIPFWVRDPRFRLLGPAEILVPPRDGNMLPVQDVKDAFLRVNKRNPIRLVVMDKSKAEDTAQWLVDELGVEVVDRTQANADAIEDYDAFMKGLREGWLKHCGDKGLTTHVMNAIAAKRPGDKYRFDRPTPSRAKAKQDFRVIDALSAAAMVNQVIDAELGTPQAVPLVAVGR